MKQKVPNVGECLLLEISHEANKISMPVVVSHVTMPKKYIPGQGVTSSGSRGKINLFGYAIVKSDKTNITMEDINSYKVIFQIRFTSNNNFNTSSGEYVRIYVEDDDIVTRPNLRSVANELSLSDELISTSISKGYIRIFYDDFPPFNVKFRKL